MRTHIFRSSRAALALASLVLLVQPLAGPAGATATEVQTFEGTYRTVALTPLPGQPPGAGDFDVLLRGNEQFELKALGERRPASGTAVRVTGRLTGSRGASGSPILEVATLDVERSRAIMGAPTTTGTTRVLVILATWTSPDSVTPAAARTRVLTEDSAWFQEVSYGQLQLTGDVTDWLTIAPPATTCEYNDIMTKARAAAKTAGYNHLDYGRTVVYLPKTPDCQWAGLGDVAGDRVWLNGHLSASLHEQGHNYGLQHAHSYTCENAAGQPVVMDDAARCTVGEYGDPFDVMGGSAAHFSAAQKDRLGWFGARAVKLASGGSAVLAPYAVNTASTLAARVDVSASRTYWFEYRQAVGRDSHLPPGAVDGILVHLVDQSLAKGPMLLDQRTGTAANFSDAALPFGSTWTTPDNWKITVGAKTTSGVSISVLFGVNDAFAEPMVVDGVNGEARSDTSGATKEVAEPNHAGNPGGKSVWFRWTAPLAGPATVDTAGSAIDTVLGVYTGSAVTALTPVASNDNVSGADPTSRVNFPAVAGTTYQIAVDGAGGATGAVRITWGINRGAGTGLAATYFDNWNLTTPKLTRIDPGVNFDWGTGSPDPLIAPDTFSVRWTGEVQAQLSETYTFYTATDDGVRLWINDQLLIDKWVAQSRTEWQANVTMTAGARYSIKMEYYEGYSDGVAVLLWSSPSSRKQAIPASQLYPRRTSVRGDVDGDGDADLSVFRPSSGVWYTATPASSLTFGSSGDIPVPGDYDGDRNTDEAVFRPSTGVWYLNSTPAASVPFGANGDIPVPADYDGDGRTDIAVFRPANNVWYVQNPAQSVVFGSLGDIPVPGDYDGDGRVELAVFRPSSGVWYINGPSPSSPIFGMSGDIPVPADYDGDGRTDIAVFRPTSGVWYIGGASPAAIAFGTSGDAPQPGDFNGDGRADIALFRPSTNVWYVQNPAQSVPFGADGDLPLLLPDAIRRFAG